MECMGILITFIMLYKKNLDMCNSNEKMKRLINNKKKALFEKVFHVR